MKAILVFKLPSQKHEFDNAMQGAKMRSILWNYNEFLRSKLKYEDLTDLEFEVYKNCKNELIKMVNAENIDLEQ